MTVKRFTNGRKKWLKRRTCSDVRKPRPAHSVEFADPVKEKLEALLWNLDGLRRPINGMLDVLQRRPRDEETSSVEGRPGCRYISRKPSTNPVPIPGVTLLYRIEEDRIMVWGVRVEMPDGEVYTA